MKFLYAAMIGLLTFSFISCHKHKRDLKAPQPLMLIPVHNGARLSDAVLNQVGMYYYINLSSTHKEPVADFGRAAGSDYQKGIVSTRDIASLSAGEDIKSFYLTFPDGTIDTLSVDYETISEEEARTNPCFCNKPQRSISINGQAAQLAYYNTDSIPVYWLYK